MRTPTSSAADPRDRRLFARWSMSRRLQWRVANGHRVRDGWIVEHGLSGLVIEADDSVPVETGMRVVACAQNRDAVGFRRAIVKRIEASEPGVVRLYAEIES